MRRGSLVLLTRVEGVRQPDISPFYDGLFFACVTDFLQILPPLPTLLEKCGLNALLVGKKDVNL